MHFFLYMAEYNNLNGVKQGQITTPLVHGNIHGEFGAIKRLNS